MIEATQDQIELLKLLEAKEAEFKYNKFNFWFPDTGPYRRELYKAHIDFITATASHSQLAFVAANRTGKSETGAYIVAAHATGVYPSWWKGRKFKNAVNIWVAGKTNEKTKEIIQKALLGPDTDIGTGMIPKDKIVKLIKKHGMGETIWIAQVRHISGEISIIEFKSYEQGRDGFEGTKQQVIWLDEEPKDASIYSECVMRLTDPIRPGIIICTFTPLYGLSEVVTSFLPGGRFPINGVHPKDPDKFVIQTTWDDVPHLTQADKDRMWAAALPHERMARSKGIPSVGAGAVYPYDEDDILIDPIPIPHWWPKGYGMDVGWGRTAAVFGAVDPDSGIVYLYSEYYTGREIPAVHASAIKSRGWWLVGACDPDGVNQNDGTHMFDMYESEGLNLIKADKRSVDAGIFKVCQLIETGRLKVFNTMPNWIEEFRSYGRDEHGKIIKKKDHLMDATRYFIFSGLDYVRTAPDNEEYENKSEIDLGRDLYTGY